MAHDSDNSHLNISYRCENESNSTQELNKYGNQLMFQVFNESDNQKKVRLTTTRDDPDRIHKQTITSEIPPCNITPKFNKVREEIVKSITGDESINVYDTGGLIRQINILSGVEGARHSAAQHAHDRIMEYYSNNNESIPTKADTTLKTSLRRTFHSNIYPTSDDILTEASRAKGMYNDTIHPNILKLNKVSNEYLNMADFQTNDYKEAEDTITGKRRILPRKDLKSYNHRRIKKLNPHQEPTNTKDSVSLGGNNIVNKQENEHYERIREIYTKITDKVDKIRNATHENLQVLSDYKLKQIEQITTINKYMAKSERETIIPNVTHGSILHCTHPESELKAMQGVTWKHGRNCSPQFNTTPTYLIRHKDFNDNMASKHVNCWRLKNPSITLPHGIPAVIIPTMAIPTGCIIDVNYRAASMFPQTTMSDMGMPRLGQCTHSLMTSHSTAFNTFPSSFNTMLRVKIPKRVLPTNQPLYETIVSKPVRENGNLAGFLNCYSDPHKTLLHNNVIGITARYCCNIRILNNCEGVPTGLGIQETINDLINNLIVNKKAIINDINSGLHNPLGLLDLLAKEPSLAAELEASRASLSPFTDLLKCQNDVFLIERIEDIITLVKYQTLNYILCHSSQLSHTNNSIFRQIHRLKDNVYHILNKIEQEFTKSNTPILNVTCEVPKVLEETSTAMGFSITNVALAAYSKLKPLFGKSLKLLSIFIGIELLTPRYVHSEYGSKLLQVSSNLVHMNEIKRGRDDKIYTETWDVIDRTAELHSHPLLSMCRQRLHWGKHGAVESKGAIKIDLDHIANILEDMLTSRDTILSESILNYLMRLTPDTKSLPFTTKITDYCYQMGQEIVVFPLSHKDSDFKNVVTILPSEYLSSTIAGNMNIIIATIGTYISATPNIGTHDELLDLSKATDVDMKVINEFRETNMEMYSNAITSIDELMSQFTELSVLNLSALTDIPKKLISLLTAGSLDGKVCLDHVISNSLKFLCQTTRQRSRDVNQSDDDKIRRQYKQEARVCIQFSSGYNFLQKILKVLNKLRDNVKATYSMFDIDLQNRLRMKPLDASLKHIDNIWDSFVNILVNIFEINHKSNPKFYTLNHEQVRQIYLTPPDQLLMLQIPNIKIHKRPDSNLCKKFASQMTWSMTSDRFNELAANDHNFIIEIIDKDLEVYKNDFHKRNPVQQAGEMYNKVLLNAIACCSAKLKQVYPLIHNVYLTSAAQLEQMVKYNPVCPFWNGACNGATEMHLHNTHNTRRGVSGTIGLISREGKEEICRNFKDLLIHICDNIRGSRVINFKDIYSLYDDDTLDHKYIMGTLKGWIVRSLQRNSLFRSMHLNIDELDLLSPQSNMLFGIRTTTKTPIDFSIDDLLNINFDLTQLLHTSIRDMIPSLFNLNVMGKTYPLDYMKDITLPNLLSKIKVMNRIAICIHDNKEINMKDIHDRSVPELPMIHADILNAFKTLHVNQLVEESYDIAFSANITSKKIVSNFNDLIPKLSKGRCDQLEPKAILFDFAKYKEVHGSIRNSDLKFILRKLAIFIDWKHGISKPPDDFDHYQPYLSLITVEQRNKIVGEDQLDGAIWVKDKVSDVIPATVGLYSDDYGPINYDMRFESDPPHIYSLFHISGGSYKEREPKIRIFIRQSEYVRCSQPNLVNVIQKLCKFDKVIRIGQTDGEQTMHDEDNTGKKSSVNGTYDIEGFCYAQNGVGTRFMNLLIGKITGTGFAFFNLENAIRKDGLAISDNDHISSLCTDNPFGLYYARRISGSHQGMNQEVWSYRTVGPILLAASLCNLNTTYEIKGDNINTTSTHPRDIDWPGEHTFMTMVAMLMGACGMSLSMKETVISQGALNNCQRTSVLGLQLNTQLKGTTNALITEDPVSFNMYDKLNNVLPIISDASENNTSRYATPLLKMFHIIMSHNHPRVSSLHNTYGISVIDILQQVTSPKKVSGLPSILPSESEFSDPRAPVTHGIVSTIVNLRPNDYVGYGLMKFLHMKYKIGDTPERLISMLEDYNQVHYDAGIKAPTTKLEGVKKILSKLCLKERLGSSNLVPTGRISGIPPNPEGTLRGRQLNKSFEELADTLSDDRLEKYMNNIIENNHKKNKMIKAPISMLGLIVKSSPSNILNNIQSKNTDPVHNDPIGFVNLYGFNHKVREAWGFNRSIFDRAEDELRERDLINDHMGGYDQYDDDITGELINDCMDADEDGFQLDTMWLDCGDTYDVYSGIDDEPIHHGMKPQHNHIVLNDDNTVLNDDQFKSIKYLKHYRFETICAAVLGSTMANITGDRDITTYLTIQAKPRVKKKDYLEVYAKKHSMKEPPRLFSDLSRHYYQVAYNVDCTDKVAADFREYTVYQVNHRKNCKFDGGARFMKWLVQLHDESRNTKNRSDNQVASRLNHYGPGHHDKFKTRNIKLEAIMALGSSITDKAINNLLLFIKVLLVQKSQCLEGTDEYNAVSSFLPYQIDTLRYYVDDLTCDNIIRAIKREVDMEKGGRQQSISHRLVCDRNDDVQMSVKRHHEGSHITITVCNRMTEETNFINSEFLLYHKTVLAPSLILMLGHLARNHTGEIAIYADRHAMSKAGDTIENLEIANEHYPPTALPQALMSNIGIKKNTTNVCTSGEKWVEHYNDLRSDDERRLAYTTLVFYQVLVEVLHKGDKEVKPHSLSHGGLIHFKHRLTKVDTNWLILLCGFEVLNRDKGMHSLLEKCIANPRLLQQDYIITSFNNAFHHKHFKPAIIHVANLLIPFQTAGCLSNWRTCFQYVKKQNLYAYSYSDVRDFLRATFLPTLRIIINGLPKLQLRHDARVMFHRTCYLSATRNTLAHLLGTANLLQDPATENKKSLFFISREVHKKINPVDVNYIQGLSVKLHNGIQSSQHYDDIYNVLEPSRTLNKFSVDQMSTPKDICLPNATARRYVEYLCCHDAFYSKTLFVLIGDTMMSLADVLRHVTDSEDAKAIIISKDKPLYQASEMKTMPCKLCNSTKCRGDFVLNCNEDIAYINIRDGNNPNIPALCANICDDYGLRNVVIINDANTGHPLQDVELINDCVGHMTDISQLISLNSIEMITRITVKRNTIISTLDAIGHDDDDLVINLKKFSTKIYVQSTNPSCFQEQTYHGILNVKGIVARHSIDTRIPIQNLCNRIQSITKFSQDHVAQYMYHYFYQANLIGMDTIYNPKQEYNNKDQGIVDINTLTTPYSNSLTGYKIKTLLRVIRTPKLENRKRFFQLNLPQLERMLTRTHNQVTRDIFSEKQCQLNEYIQKLKDESKVVHDDLYKIPTGVIRYSIVEGKMDELRTVTDDKYRGYCPITGVLSRDGDDSGNGNLSHAFDIMDYAHNNIKRFSTIVRRDTYSSQSILIKILILAAKERMDTIDIISS